MRVAIVHYWLLGMRGGEKVLEALCRLLPEADIFTLFYDPGTRFAADSLAARDRFIPESVASILPVAAAADAPGAGTFRFARV